jgi:nucleoside-diphosphate-sugar epimerase
MRVFLTGGTGYIGAAVLDALVRGGHQVDALVRNSEKAADVQARGAAAVLGNLSEPATYADAVAAADGAIHTAFEYSPRGREVDAIAIETILAAPAKAGRFLIFTSGVWVLGPCASPVDESAEPSPAEFVAWRPSHERRVLDAASGGVRTAVIRPGIVYGGSRGIVGDLIKDAVNGLVRIVGSGDNHWPLVYDRDLGELYLRLAAHADAAGIFHANDEGDEQVNDLVAAIAGHVPIRPDVRRIPLAEARQKMGPYADALALDQRVRSRRSRAIGWSPSLRSVAGNAARLFDEWRRGREAASSSA